MNQIKLQSLEISDMEQYTPLERVQIVELSIKNNYSIVKIQREFRPKLNSRSAFVKNTIKKIYEKFTSTVYLGNNKKPNKSKAKCSDENIENYTRHIQSVPPEKVRVFSESFKDFYSFLLCLDCTFEGLRSNHRFVSVLFEVSDITQH